MDFKKIALAALSLVIIVVIWFVYQGMSKETKPVNDSQTEMRVGYIIYPPLLERDSSTGELKGISYDIVEAVAKEMGVKTNWVEEVGWGTALEGLTNDRYDVLGTQMWPNEAREKVSTFSNAPMNSVLFPYIKKGDTRFSADNLQAMNSADVTISALDGEMAGFIAKEDYPNAKVNSLPQLSSYAEVFLNIVQNKADVTFVEPSAAEDFLKSHQDSIERLGNAPVRSFGNSFAFSKSNTALVNEWNEVLEFLKQRGEIEAILKRHGVESHYQVN